VIKSTVWRKNYCSNINIFL